MTLTCHHSETMRRILKPSLSSHMFFWFTPGPEEGARTIFLVLRSHSEISCLSSFRTNESVTSSRQGHAPLHMSRGGGMWLILRKEAWPLLIWQLGAAAGSSPDPVFGCQNPVPLSFQPDFHFRQGLRWTEASNIWISWYWHPCRKVGGFKKKSPGWLHTWKLLSFIC